MTMCLGSVLAGLPISLSSSFLASTYSFYRCETISDSPRSASSNDQRYHSSLLALEESSPASRTASSTRSNTSAERVNIRRRCRATTTV
ncbi:hypothetical protein BKA62DRAFT_719983, partial [Auriculariales sp. MPI-PUGE-AT-0066]